MAAPITHIALSAKVYQKFFSTCAREDFFVGTSFPDIRYLGGLKREQTHFSGLALEDLKGSDSFEIGLKFHSILDEKREKFVIENDIYSFLPKMTGAIAVNALKLLEDEYSYGLIENWSEYIAYFDGVHPQELIWGASPDEAKRWHELLKSYLAQKPSEDSLRSFWRGINRPEDVLREVLENVKALRDFPETNLFFKKMYEEAEFWLSGQESLESR